MELLMVFFAGLAAAAGAVLGPGMLNMNVVRRSLKHGRRAGLLFAAGIVTVFLAQATAGVIGANYLGINDRFLESLKSWAIPIFLVLAFFFAYRGYLALSDEESKSDEENDDGTGNHYLAGLSLAVFNVLAIPYFYALGVYAFDGGRLAGGIGAKVLFVLSAATGAFLIFSAYATAAPWVRSNARPLTRNINFVVAGLLTIAALTQTYRMLIAG